MKTRPKILFLIFLVVILSACAAPAPEPEVIVETVVVEKEGETIVETVEVEAEPSSDDLIAVQDVSELTVAPAARAGKASATGSTSLAMPSLHHMPAPSSHP